MSKTKTKKRGGRYAAPSRSPAVFLCGAVLVVSFLCFFAARWFLSVYGQIGFDAVLFTLQSSLGGVETELVVSFLFLGLFPALLLGGIACILLFTQSSKKLTIPFGKRRFSIFPFRSGVAICLSLTLSAVLLCSAAVAVELDDHIYDTLTDGHLFENHYVDPDTVEITFPEEKRNLVYIMLESMEISYLSGELGGAVKENLIPELYQIALENTNFSHNGSVGGFYETSGASWTIGSMVAQTAGIPLKTPEGLDDWQNGYGKDGVFLPGATSLTSILSDAGYYTTLMVGSDANFGGRKVYYTTHGADYVYDVYTARKDGIIPNDYFEWWGMEDLYLFEYAKQELAEISRQDQPFAFTMLTVDTHHIGGYQCAYCTDSISGETYDQSISCSSRQVLEFLEWMQAQPWWDNTTVVITGDHRSMDKGYFDRNVDEDYERMVYNVIINAPVDSDNTKNRTYCAMDLFPTTLAALGCEIEGDRLGLGTNLYSDTPTLAEAMGFEQFNDALSQSSIYYGEHFYEPKS